MLDKVQWGAGRVDIASHTEGIYLHLERTSLDAVRTLVKTGMNCHIILLLIFIVDPLEMLGIFCVSVQHRGIWIFLLRCGGSTVK